MANVLRMLRPSAGKDRGAAMFDFLGFKTGALAFLLAFAVAGIFTLMFKVIYQAVTPYRERDLIRQGNVAAAVALGGALIGYVLPLASALSQTVSLPEFAAWATLAGVIQIVTFVAVRMVAMPDVKARIEGGELSAAIYLASVSIAVGLLNAACMTA
jgi:putative membrane protein